MKIEDIKINSFGTINNKEIKLENGINIIHGNNESGKSTLVNYIIDMFYGISRKLDGKNITDYEKYSPWNNNEFSGRLSYILDNGEKYEIYRDFRKKNPQIYNSQLDDISSDYDIDKKEGNKFFIQQTNIDKEMYLSTLIAMQQEVELDNKEQNVLVQKIANLANTGDDSISYKKANEKLEKKIRDEIGTNKTSQKPINIIIKELQKISEEIKNIEPFVERKYTIDSDKENIKNIRSLELKYKEILTEIKNFKEINKIQKSKIDMNIKKVKENKDKLKELTDQQNQYETQKDKLSNQIESIIENKGKKPNKLDIILEIVMIIGILCGKLILHNVILTIVPLILFIILIAKYFIVNNKNKKVKENKINDEREELSKLNNNIYILKGQILLLEKENEKIDTDTNNITKEINGNILNKKYELIEKYKSNINENELEDMFDLEDVEEKINNIESKLQDNSIKLNKLELEESNIIEQTNRILLLKEREEYYNQKLSELNQKQEIIQISIENLKEAYEEMKKTITPWFKKELSKNMAIISNNKYNNVNINDEKGIIIENEKKEYIEADRLSLGTIDQLYLSLRLAMIDNMSNESLPIILDETFAYFDSERLENVLQYLSKNLNNHQIIILTCTNREKEILNTINIKYNNLELSSM